MARRSLAAARAASLSRVHNARAAQVPNRPGANPAIRTAPIIAASGSPATYTRAKSPRTIESMAAPAPRKRGKSLRHTWLEVSPYYRDSATHDVRWSATVSE